MQVHSHRLQQAAYCACALMLRSLLNLSWRCLLLVMSMVLCDGGDGVNYQQCWCIALVMGMKTPRIIAGRGFGRSEILLLALWLLTVDGWDAAGGPSPAPHRRLSRRIRHGHGAPPTLHQEGIDPAYPYLSLPRTRSPGRSRGALVEWYQGQVKLLLPKPPS